MTVGSLDFTCRPRILETVDCLAGEALAGLRTEETGREEREREWWLWVKRGNITVELREETARRVSSVGGGERCAFLLDAMYAQISLA